MKDHIVIAQNEKTKLFYALYYVNHPTPSGCDRPILKLSTKEGFKTKQEALDKMKAAFSVERLAEMDIPDLNESVKGGI